MLETESEPLAMTLYDPGSEMLFRNSDKFQLRKFDWFWVRNFQFQFQTNQIFENLVGNDVAVPSVQPSAVRTADRKDEFANILACHNYGWLIFARYAST